MQTIKLQQPCTLNTNQMHILLTIYCQVYSTPPTAQDSPWISPNSQLEPLTKPDGMPTKPQEILKYPTTSSLSP